LYFCQLINLIKTLGLDHRFGNDDWVSAPVIPAKAGIQRIVANMISPQQIENLQIFVLKVVLHHLVFQQFNGFSFRHYYMHQSFQEPFRKITFWKG